MFKTTTETKSKKRKKDKKKERNKTNDKQTKQKQKKNIRLGHAGIVKIKDILIRSYYEIIDNVN